jgi:hypothetical protein
MVGRALHDPGSIEFKNMRMIMTINAHRFVLSLKFNAQPPWQPWPSLSSLIMLMATSIHPSKAHL